MSNWSYKSIDEDIARGIRGILPSRMFDAHCHIYRVRDFNLEVPSLCAEGPDQVDIDTWRLYLGRQVGEGRLQGGMFMPFPTKTYAVRDGNDFLVEQLAKWPDSRGLIIVTPETSPEDVKTYLSNPRIVGFKPYYCYSRTSPVSNSLVDDFLPEWAWKLADEKGLIITLHLVRERALSDPDNQSYICRMCAKHPNAKLVLAHCGRGFHAPNTANGLNAVRGLSNVWFDMSGICEPSSITAILEEFGPRKLLWGSDFPVSEIRGKCVTVGADFAWISPERMDLDETAPECRNTLVGLESLRALKESSDQFGLNDQDLRDIFCDNALRLVGIMKETGTATQNLYKHAKTRIPGGTQLLSKRPEMMAPDMWPAYFREARGCEVWDLDGRHYYDMSLNGIGSCLLGFRDPDVTRAVQRRIKLGSMCTLNPPEEVELADLLCEIHPWAEQVRFARCGGEVAAIAARIARATTDRTVIAVSGYHGWQDWYLAANLGETDALRGHLLPGLEPLGVPSVLRGTTVTFRADDREAFQRVLHEHGDRLAAVIMEPCRDHYPAPGFLQFVKDGAHKAGALLVFDEITIGFRLHFGGSHLKLGVSPDMAIFAKALGNGHPIAAVIGTGKAMAGCESTFISSTYWTESVGPAAALAVLKKMKMINVPDHVAQIGTIIGGYWRSHAAKHGLPVEVEEGYPCLAHFAFKHELANELRTLYTQLMLERGFLAGTAIYPTLAHNSEIASRYGAAVDEVFAEIADAIAEGDIRGKLKGPVAHTGFRRLI